MYQSITSFAIVCFSGLMAPAAEPPQVVDSELLELAAPIKTWDEAIPLGNGLTGGLLWGRLGYLIYLSENGQQWGKPVAEGELADHTRLQTIRFADTTAQYVRFEAISSHEENAWASLAELEIVAPGEQE